MAKKPFTINQLEAAYLLDVDGRTIQAWCKRQENPLPVKADTKRGQAKVFDPQELVKWLIRYELSKLHIHEGEVLDLNAERARLARIQGDKLALDLAEKQGRVVDPEMLSDSWDKIVLACRSRLLAMPAKIAPQVLAAKTLAEKAEVMRAEIHDALTELSQMDVERVISTKH